MVRRRVCARDVGESCHDVVLGKDVVADSTGFDFPWPTYQERNLESAVEEIPLPPLEIRRSYEGSRWVRRARADVLGT